MSADVLACGAKPAPAGEARNFATGTARGTASGNYVPARGAR